MAIDSTDKPRPLPLPERFDHPARLLLVAVAYYLSAKAGLLLAFENASVTAVWPPAGLALAALLLWGPRMWPAVAAGALLANLDVGWAALGIMVGNTLEAVVAAALLRRVGFSATLARVRDVVAFVGLAAILSTTISATIGIASLWAHGSLDAGSLASVWRIWWFGDATGDLIVGVALLVAASHRHRIRNLASLGEGVLALALVTTLGLVAFVQDQPILYLVYPPLFWVAFRMHQVGAAASGLILASIGIVFTSQDTGPLAFGSQDSDLIRSQGWAAMAVVTSLLVAAVRTERLTADSEKRAAEMATGALERERGRLRNAVERLRSSEALNARIQRIGQIGGWEWDLQTDVVRISEELVRILGPTPDGGGGPLGAMLEMVHPDDRPRVERSLREAVETRGGFTSEHRWIRADGRTLMLEAHAEVVTGPGGEPILMRGVAQDVSLRREAERNFRQLLEAAPDAMVIVNEAGDIVLVNAQAERLFGYARDELVGRTVETVIPARLRDGHVSHRNAFAKHPSIRPMGAGRELFALRSDGRELPVEVSLSPIDTEAGRLVVGAIRDVSERRLAESKLREWAARMEEAQEIARFGIWEWTPATDTVTWSDLLHEIYGLEPGSFEPSLSAYLERVHPEDREKVSRAIGGAVERRTPFAHEERVVRPNGEVRLLRSQGRPILDENGNVVRMVGVCQDVTELREAEDARREAEARFRNAFENAPIGIALSTVAPEGENRFIDVNESFCEMTGYSEEELLGIDPRALRDPRDGDPDPQARETLLAGESTAVTLERRLLRADGESIWVLASASLVRDADGTPQYAIIQVQDISERKRFEVELRHLADHDALTGLQNRRRFLEELDRQVAHQARYGGEAAVLVIDLDHFKYVNDTLGHAVGDDMIRRVGALLRERLRETDVVARLGGDEFAVLLPAVSAQEARHVADELLEHIRTLSVAIGSDRPIRLSASIGVSPFSQEPDLTGEMVLVNADIAMYQGKDAGRNRVALLETLEEPKTRMRARMTWVDRVRSALEEERFTLYGQPILDLRNGGAPRYELLLRMLGEHGEVIPPASFLSIAEEFGLIQAIDKWVVRHAVQLSAERSRRGDPTVFEVNLSGSSITEPDVLEVIEHELHSSKADPRTLVFEVTETAAIVNIDRANRFADHLAELGCGFALDDFGAGFGSFYYLKHLPFDYLKIDGDFIRSLPDSSPDQVTVKAIVQIARGLEKRTIAEFVQDERTLNLLREYGVDFAQGYHVGRPEPTSGWRAHTERVEEQARQDGREGLNGGRGARPAFRGRPSRD